ncbi:hypothetical protein [Streptomyces narbonensis]
MSWESVEAPAGGEARGTIRSWARCFPMAMVSPQAWISAVIARAALVVWSKQPLTRDQCSSRAVSASLRPLESSRCTAFVPRIPSASRDAA